MFAQLIEEIRIEARTKEQQYAGSRAMAKRATKEFLAKGGSDVTKKGKLDPIQGRSLKRTLSWKQRPAGSKESKVQKYRNVSRSHQGLTPKHSAEITPPGVTGMTKVERPSRMPAMPGKKGRLVTGGHLTRMKAYKRKPNLPGPKPGEK